MHISRETTTKSRGWIPALIVVFAIGFLAWLFYPVAFPNHSASPERVVHAQIRYLEIATISFAESVGMQDASGDILAIMSDHFGDVLDDSAQHDPWGVRFACQFDADDQLVTILSSGPDKVRDTDDDVVLTLNLEKKTSSWK
ncbi:MAG: hypothetical protein AAGK04_08095 [Planctomycetota bacterium]